MSLKISNLIHKDISKILILIYIIQSESINKSIKISEISRFLYRFYIDNPNIAETNNNVIVRNIKKYISEDLLQITKLGLYDWKNDFPNGCLNFNENEVLVNISNVDDTVYSSSWMIAKILYKKATNQDYNYEPYIKEVCDITNYDLDHINDTRIKNRVLEDMNYCCCCDSIDELFIINLSDNIKEILNPYNYITVCKEHYDLFKNGYYKFNENGQIIILKSHNLLNPKMHIALKIIKKRREAYKN